MCRIKHIFAKGLVHLTHAHPHARAHTHERERARERERERSKVCMRVCACIPEKKLCVRKEREVTRKDMNLLSSFPVVECVRRVSNAETRIKT